MELTRTDAVFSRIAMVLFLCRKSKFLELDETFWRFFIEYIKNIGIKNYWRGATQCPRGTRARHPPGAPWYLVGPTWLRLTYFQRYKFIFVEKKIREEVLLRFTIRSRRHLLFFIGRPDLESVQGSGEGDLPASSSSTILHHQFHDAHRRE
jgi:hypothetical protein